MITLKQTEEFGRGLYASEVIEAGTILMDCELLVLSPEDTLKVNQTDLQYYTFVFDSIRDCLVLGLGEIFNHADASNVSYALVDIGPRSVMRFTATTAIEAGAQLMINYNADALVATASYTVNLTA